MEIELFFLSNDLQFKKFVNFNTIIALQVFSPWNFLSCIASGTLSNQVRKVS